MCIFKRILALVLTLALLSTCALSETLRLPESLQRIESEAFSGISSADTVHIPWGTVSIGSLAFADSSISTIYIPDTVTSIADNAFRNTALTIYSAPGTAGHEFALKHDLPWRDCGDYFHQDRMEELNSLLDTSLDDLYMDDSLLLSEEGITDAETLTFIREYNAFVADFYETYTAYNSTIENLYSQMESIPDLVNEFDYCEADGSVSYVTGLGTLIIDENAMGVSAEEVISIQTDEDTHCSTLLTESGAAYYMYVSGGNVRISAEPGVSTLTSRASRSQHEQFISRVNQANTLFSSLDKLFSASIDHLQDLIAHYDQAIEWINHYKTTRMSGTSSAVYQRAEELLKARKASKAQAQSCVSNLKYAKRVFAFINIPSIIANCYVIGEHWARVLDIDGENHPLSMDYTYPEGLRLSREMNTSIQQLCILYAGEALVSIIEVYESLVTIASLVTTIASSISGPAALIPATATLTSLVLSLATVGAEFMLDCIADSIYNSIIDTDEQLHTCVTGIVRDKETGKPLPHVGVVAYTGDISHVNTSNSISGVTDSSGRYTLPLPYGRMNLLFRKAQYEDAQDEVAPVAGQTVTNDDIELDPKNGTLFGIVYEETARLPIEGALVVCGDLETYTDVNGNFSLSVPEGSASVQATKYGYADSENKPVTIVKDQVNIVELPMGKQNIILTREDLENVKNNPNGDYVLGATIDLSGAEWSPLPWFGGTLDGNGYSITGMTVTSGQSVGLFQGLYGGYVHDLLIVDASVTVPSLPDFTNAGLLGGSLNNGSRVENVTVIGDISVTPGNGKAFVGGFTGYIGDAAMTNCFAMTTINVSTANGANVGGIAGGTGTCSLVHCDADLSITVKQSESNSSATYFVYGNTYVSSTDAADCAVRGSIFVQTLDGVCNVYGISGVSDGKNHASISVLTENGTANAFGSIDGLNCMNDGVVLATATGSGNATAVGVNGQGACINEGAVSAYSASGAASATGIQSAGDHARNSAGVRSETKTGSANATGIYAPGAANCKNACSVTAKAEKGSTYAVGLSSCTDSENSGSVSVSVQTGSAVVQGISQCSDSVNNANVTASYEGTASGSLSCQGLNNCTGSVNYGSTTGVVNGSTTACTVTAAANGNGNTNYGRVEARSSTGPANARGVYCSRSTNYGTIYAQSTCPTVSEIANATAYGIGPGYSNCVNEGSVYAISRSSVAYAYGFSGGSNNTSTGIVSAVSQYFLIRQIEGGYEGELGRAYAYNSAFTMATVYDCTASAAGNETVNMYFFIARSSCSNHAGMPRAFVTFNAATQPSLDGCYIACGSAVAVSPQE